MDLSLNTELSDRYTSSSQRVRILTEDWVDKQIYCPNCGQSSVSKYENNRPVADFFCSSCLEEYELKSKKNSVGTKIVDGAYRTMIERLQSANNPNFFLLNYNPQNLSVLNFFVVPKHFFVPTIIEKREALSQTARRAGWVGCNILLHGIPQIGRIFFVKNRLVEPKEKVIANWQKTLFLREEKEASARGWLLDVMRVIEHICRDEFTLEDVYKFAEELSRLHPENNHIKDKIRQQMQILRDKGYLEFIGRGVYNMR